MRFGSILSLIIFAKIIIPSAADATTFTLKYDVPTCVSLGDLPTYYSLILANRDDYAKKRYTNCALLRAGIKVLVLEWAGDYVKVLVTVGSNDYELWVMATSLL
ncbi:hypothetical protein JQ615_18340 [Bradyrhizobium jicamae]|uniref:Uncharacterized protein n=1 Tax=Bradyrhizobium jicamae TaxID=280332 RepID=A0ABS5FKN5_9BRAD|nr:hypothetical protein [Bradyrhizobium jicamae]MBR0797350.1 hypothetical protein [Bradyrhizobium jicamae]